METIFDHNITNAEIVDLLGSELSPKEVSEIFVSQLENDALIYKLYIMRGDKDNAAKYLDKIPDSKQKFFNLMLSDF